jgi:hypothetical protein
MNVSYLCCIYAKDYAQHSSFMQGSLPLPATLRVAQDLTEVVAPFGFKSVCRSLNWRCGIKLFLNVFRTEKRHPPPSTV